MFNVTMLLFSQLNSLTVILFQAAHVRSLPQLFKILNFSMIFLNINIKQSRFCVIPLTTFLESDNQWDLSLNLFYLFYWNEWRQVK